MEVKNGDELNAQDVKFAEKMITHHEQAIAMAKYQMIYGQYRGLRKIAREIVNGQQSEIDTLKRILTNVDSDDMDEIARKRPWTSTLRSQ